MAGRTHLDSAQVARVLYLVRESTSVGPNGTGAGTSVNGYGNSHGNSSQVPANAAAILNRAINELWSRIQADPNAYVMNRYEFQLFNYFRSHFGQSIIAERAVARFWNNYGGELAEVNGV